MTARGLGWPGIVRLGLVQTAIGALFALTSLTLNRIMVVEFAMPAVLPAALVAWNYVAQLSRPRWGYGSDIGKRRSPWIIGGMGVMALGALIATDATTSLAASPLPSLLAAFLGFTMVGVGVGAAGTSLLALLATRVAPERRPAAAATTWIMMIAGFIVYAAVSGLVLQPFSPQRLALLASGVSGVSFVVALLAVRGAEEGDRFEGQPATAPPGFFRVVADIWAEPVARRFTVFVFVSMLAYSAQELILEPFAGLVFGMSPAQSAQLTGAEKGGALLGMILAGALAARFGGRDGSWMRRWTAAGCVGSAVALVGLGAAGAAGTIWALTPTVFLLGLANGVFAVSAIGAMMGLAGSGAGTGAGARMGVWGGAQAGAFAIGGFLGATGVEVLRGLLERTASAFVLVFAAQALLFLCAGVLAIRLEGRAAEADTPIAVELKGAHG